MLTSNQLPTTGTTIAVTVEHIANGKCADHNLCPIAQAITTAYPEHYVTVGANQIILTPLQNPALPRHVFSQSALIQEWISRFDSGHKPGPIQIYLDHTNHTAHLINQTHPMPTILELTSTTTGTIALPITADHIQRATPKTTTLCPISITINQHFPNLGIQVTAGRILLFNTDTTVLLQNAQSLQNWIFTYDDTNQQQPSTLLLDFDNRTASIQP